MRPVKGTTYPKIAPAVHYPLDRFYVKEGNMHVQVRLDRDKVFLSHSADGKPLEVVSVPFEEYAEEHRALLEKLVQREKMKA